ncbi:hypothetical protein V8D89_009818 [Ganoderma adspersum]
MTISGRAIGIDLGTTNCRVAVWHKDRVEIIPNDQGNPSTPSYVAFTDTDCLIGDIAKTQAALNPRNTVFNVKRLIGRPFSDPGVQSDIAHFPFSVVDRDAKPCIRVRYRGQMREFAPEEILSIILAYLKKAAEAFLHDTVIAAVVAVPVHFNYAQRHTVEAAARAAGLKVHRLVTEPSCSALACCLPNTVLQPNHEVHVLVLDVGRGSTSVQLFTIDEGTFAVRGTAGVSHLGGDDFDSRLVSHLAQRFRREHGPGMDLTGNARALCRLRTACESAKCTLSEATKAAIAIDSLCAGVDLYTAVITRAQFEEVCQDLCRAVCGVVERVLDDAEIDRAQVDKIVLIGGSTRIPKLVQLVSDFFGGKQPTRVTRLNQDMSEKLRELRLLDSTPFSLGIGTVSGIMAPVVKRNTSVPTKRVETVTTTFDNQPGVLVEVYEGERARTEDNTLLARVVLAGIPPAPRGVPRLEVTFDVDINQHLTVSVTDTNTGRSSSVAVPGSGNRRGLTDAEMVDMVVEANIAAARAAARARIEGYVGGLREVLQELDMALHLSDSWLGDTQDASILEYNAHRMGLEAVVRPLAEQFSAAVASDGIDGVDIPEVDVVDEEILRKWAVAVVVSPDDVPPAAPDAVHELEDDAMDTRD